MNLDDHPYQHDHATCLDYSKHLLHDDIVVHYLGLFGNDHPSFDHHYDACEATAVAEMNGELPRAVKRRVHK